MAPEGHPLTSRRGAGCSPRLGQPPAPLPGPAACPCAGTSRAGPGTAQRGWLGAGPLPRSLLAAEELKTQPL